MKPKQNRAPKPKENMAYKLRNAHNSKVMSVASNSLDDNAHLTQYHWTENDSQKWGIYPIDLGYNVFFNLNSGKVISVASNSIQEGAHITQYHWTGNDSQKWAIKDTNYWMDNAIENYASGRVISLENQSIEDNVHLVQYLYTDEIHMKWVGYELEPFTTIPTVATEILPPPPQYNNIDEQLPAQTTPVITAYTVAPFFAIYDQKYGSNTAAQVKGTPFYLYIKRQYWQKVESHVFAPSEQFKYTETSGITQTEQDVSAEITSNTIGADAGLQFRKFSLGLSEQYTEQLATIKSSTTEEMKEQTVEYTINNPYDYRVAWTKYILCTEYHIERPDGTVVGSPWTLKNKSETNSVYYPPIASLVETIEKEKKKEKKEKNC